MIVCNWPDRCPVCGCAEFTVSSKGPTSANATHEDAHNASIHKQNLVNLTCRDSQCLHPWVLELKSYQPFVFLHPKIQPMAIVAETQEDAEVLAVLPEDWTCVPLSAILDRGTARVRYVTEAVNSATQLVGDDANSCRIE